MKVQRILPLLVVGLIGTGLQAEDLDIGLKLRAIAGTKVEAGVKDGLSVGIGVAIPMPFLKGSKLNTELGYRYYAGDGGRQPIPANTLGCVPDNVPNPNPALVITGSTNFQKLTVQGFYGRFTFGMPIMENLSWHAGVEIDVLKSRMDAIGDFRTNPAPSSQAGAWSFNPEQKGTTASPLAGIAYQFNTAGALELNLFMATYKQVTLTPTQDPAGAGTKRILPVIGSKNVSTLKIELGYSFRF